MSSSPTEPYRFAWVYTLGAIVGWGLGSLWLNHMFVGLTFVLLSILYVFFVASVTVHVTATERLK